MNIYFFAIVLLMACILVLEAIKNAPGNSGVQVKKHVDIGKSMTIGSREVQEDQVAAMENCSRYYGCSCGWGRAGIWRTYCKQNCSGDLYGHL